MIHRPVFKPHYLVKVIENEGVFLLSERHQTVLQGWLYEVIAPRLDGRPVEDLCAELRGRVMPAQVYYTLNQLEKKGYIAEGSGDAATMPPGEAALWSMLRVDPGEAAGRLARSTVALTVFGDVDIEPFRALLGALRVRVAEAGSEEVGLGVVVTDHYLRDGLQPYNKEALRTGRPWLLIKPVGTMVWIGPLFRPGITGCWECLAERIRANFPILGYLDGKRVLNGAPGADRCGTPATEAVAWGLAANAVASWIAQGESPQLEGRVQTFDALGWRGESHALVRHPTCPSCGTAPPEAAAPDQGPAPPRVVQLTNRKKAFTDDGGHRAVPPRETLQRFGHHVSPISGVVPMMERAAPDNAGEVMHVYVSGPNIARGPRTWMGLRTDLRNSSCGKGTNEEQARASALCEGIERYSAIFRGDEPRFTSRLVDLGDVGIHPNACMLLSDRQYRNREEWNRHTTVYHYVPAPFDPEAPVEWTPVWSLTRERVAYLPTAFCFFEYPYPGGEPYCMSCSNGNAAGNTLEEAILQGFLELVERDSVALWWYNRVRRPAVDLDSFGEPYLRRLTDFLQKYRRDLWVLDLTSDLDIPVFIALSQRTDGGAEQIMFGFGAHLDPQVALLRAVTEMNQMLVHILDAPPEGPAVDRLTDPETLGWLRTATLANQPYLVPSDAQPRTLVAYPRLRTDDLRDDVLACQDRVKRLGMEMFVLDQTRPEVGMPVVKVIVPGLRHFWARFAPGRLYDVPVKLGWLPNPHPEQALNSVPMFL